MGYTHGLRKENKPPRKYRFAKIDPGKRALSKKEVDTLFRAGLIVAEGIAKKSSDAAASAIAKFIASLHDEARISVGK